ncbi:MAG: hypothetical protein JXD21_05935 [Candidatus Omnitrophica bacterium]|nr:hypothetical protein [Candidatus Omnitrophota bacterium]
MSHSLHRQGKETSLKNDFVLIALLAKSRSGQSWSEKCQNLEKLANICIRHDPDNYGQSKSVFHAVYTSMDSLEKVLVDLKRAELGISVVVTGCREEIIRMGQRIGLPLNSAHISLGIFGNKKRLPDERILAITTMCGHHCISPFLVEKIVNDLKAGRVKMEHAVERLSGLCTCGIFNRARARGLLDDILSSENTA